MNSNFLRASWLAAILPTLAGAAPLTLDTALELATLRSQSAHSARAGIASAAESARAAAQLPDPMFRAGVENVPITGPDRLSTARDSMTMKRIGISQEWLSAEKRGARSTAAQASVGRERTQLKASLGETRLQTALAYLDAFYAAEALKLTTLMQHHAHEEFEAARARLASSSGSSQDVLALTGARGMADDASSEVRQQQVAAKVTLQRWVGVPVDELEPVAATGRVSEEHFVAGYPTVLARQQDIEVARAEAAVAATNRRPNWTWEASYGQRSGFSDMVSVGVSIPLPVAPVERQDRETAAKLALVDKAEAEWAEAIRSAQGEYRALASNAQLLEERIGQYREGVVLPLQQRVAAATAGYRSNQTTLVTLFEARHAEVEAQRKLLTLQRDLARTKVQLAYRALTPEVSR